MLHSRRPCCLTLGLLLALAVLPPARPTAAAELTGFISTATPGNTWRTGFGGSITATFFNVVGFEGEAAHQGSEFLDTSMVTFTVAGLLQPPIGRLVPYGGLGVGFFRQSLGGDSDTGKVGVLILGVKLDLGVVLLRADWRSFDLPDDAPLLYDQRWAAGVGIKF